MGYESRIYVVEKSNYSWHDDDGKRYAHEIAKIEMCKCYALSDILRNKPATECYIYADDGNTRIEKDCYGQTMTETPLGEAIKIVQDVIEKLPYDYWRYHVLLATLKSIYDFVGDSDSYAVLHYGY